VAKRESFSSFDEELDESPRNYIKVFEVECLEDFARSEAPNVQVLKQTPSRKVLSGKPSLRAKIGAAPSWERRRATVKSFTTSHLQSTGALHRGSLQNLPKPHSYSKWAAN